MALRNGECNNFRIQMKLYLAKEIISITQKTAYGGSISQMENIYYKQKLLVTKSVELIDGNKFWK